MGVFFIRGDNVCLIAEIDENLENGIDYSKIKAQPIKSVLLHWNDEISIKQVRIKLNKRDSNNSGRDINVS